jgi:hypothetical protein
VIFDAEAHRDHLGHPHQRPQVRALPVLARALQEIASVQAANLSACMNVLTFRQQQVLPVLERFNTPQWTIYVPRNDLVGLQPLSLFYPNQ